MTADAEEAEQPEDDGDEKPEVDTESTVDLDAVDEALEAEKNDDASDQDDGDEEIDDAEGSEEVDFAGGGTFGDHYVNGLCTVSNAVIEHYGDDGATGVDGSMARDLELDKAMNEWIRSKGVTEEMPPGQALLIATLMFLVAALASNPAVVNGVLDELGGDTE